MIRAAVLTVSDRCARGEAEDRSGPAVAATLAEWGAEVAMQKVVPDDREAVSGAIRELAKGADLVVTTGGTGVSLRDVTPEATRAVLDRLAPGFGEEMRRRSREITPLSIVSRGIAGTLGRTFVLNLPGSPKGAVECLGFVREAVLHALHLLRSPEAAHDTTSPNDPDPS